MSAKYLVIDISSGKNGKQYPVGFLEEVPDGGWSEEYKTNKIVLRHVSAGEFRMGGVLVAENDDSEYTDGFNDNYPRRVRLTRSFYLGVFPVTQRQWSLVMGERSNHSEWRGPDEDMKPVERVSYDDIRGSRSGANWPSDSAVDACSFVGRIRGKTGLSALDLPTEAQWEYACRTEGQDGFVGTEVFDFYRQNGRVVNMGKAAKALQETVDKVAWFLQSKDAGSSGTHPVGEKEPNGLGMFDMYGNVHEWCLDWYQSIERGGTVNDPVGWSCKRVGCGRVMRGGSWSSFADECFSIRRHQFIPEGRHGTVGMRLCCHTDEIDPSALQPVASGSCLGSILKWLLVAFGAFAALKWLGVLDLLGR